MFEPYYTLNMIHTAVSTSMDVSWQVVELRQIGTETDSYQKGRV